MPRVCSSTSSTSSIGSIGSIDRVAVYFVTRLGEPFHERDVLYVQLAGCAAAVQNVDVQSSRIFNIAVWNVGLNAGVRRGR